MYIIKYHLFYILLGPTGDITNLENKYYVYELHFIDQHIKTKLFKYKFRTL